VEDNEVGAELQEEQEGSSVGEKSNWGLNNVQKAAGMLVDLLGVGEA
jgi:hypothetical protein